MKKYSTPALTFGCYAADVLATSDPKDKDFVLNDEGVWE